jgi:hypothetical protein
LPRFEDLRLIRLAWIYGYSVVLFLLLAAPGGARTLELTWNSNRESDIAGYRLRYGTGSGNYTQQINVGSTTTSATIENLLDGQRYYFALTAYNNLGLESRFSHEISYPSPDQFRNLSARGAIHLDGVLISGFIITGSGQKRIMVRALGPSLSVTTGLNDPVLELHDSSGGIISANDDWRMGDENAILASGLAPTSDKEAALIATVNPGPYTVIARDSHGASGIGLVEIYDLDEPRNTMRLVNCSTRGSVLIDDRILIGGVIIEAADNRTRILTRAIGPSLAAAGVPYALTDPMMQLYNSNGTVIASNDNWMDTQRAEIEAIGVAPSDVRESVILASCLPGHYTAVMSGKNGGMGVGLVELYSLP